MSDNSTGNRIILYDHTFVQNCYNTSPQYHTETTQNKSNFSLPCERLNIILVLYIINVLYIIYT